jgi:MFS transporter, PAT family, beta-lactamase induction signal transducer AmpG
MSQSKASYANPFLWVPTSYLAMGLIYVTVSAVANIMFKNLGLENVQAAFWSSLFILPYTIKPLWAPVVELYKTKKFFVLLMQFLLVGMVAGVAFAVRLPGASFMVPVLIMLGITGLAGATQDIASDGVYVTTLAPAEQAKYLGIQSMCWNAGPILANGVLVRLSGMLHTSTGDWGQAWMIVMLIIAALIGVIAVYHLKILPHGAKALDAPKSVADAMRTFGHTFVTFFQKRDIWLMILFAFFFRFGYGFLEKMGPLFMIDARTNGGLGLTNESLGDIYGTFGTGAFMAGSILGGLYVARRGLRRTLLLLCLCMNVPNVVFVYLSQTLTRSYPLIATVVTIEKFAWGFGAVGLMIYMMQQVAPGPYKTAHYTFATAFMGLNMMLTGMVSGAIQQLIGYRAFFILVLIAAIPSILATIYAPFHHPDSTSTTPGEPATVEAGVV